MWEERGDLRRESRRVEKRKIESVVAEERWRASEESAWR